MTVGELISELSKYDKDLEVSFDSEWKFSDIGEVEVITCEDDSKFIVLKE